METKICTKCSEEKMLSEFIKSKICKDGFESVCKRCARQRKQQWERKNSILIKEKRKKYRLLNKEIIAKQYKEWYEKNKLERREKNRLYYNANKQRILKSNANWRLKNKEKKLIMDKKWHDLNRDRRNQQTKEKYKNNPKFKLDMLFSSSINKALRNINSCKNNKSWEDLVGYNTQLLKEHLEKQFKPEMNWKNHGTYWHIDHIKPKSWFRYDSTEHPEFKKCWALENLQPLEAEKNLTKNNKYEG